MIKFLFNLTYRQSNRLSGITYDIVINIFLFIFSLYLCIQSLFFTNSYVLDIVILFHSTALIFIFLNYRMFIKEALNYKHPIIYIKMYSKTIRKLYIVLIILFSIFCILLGLHPKYGG